MKKYLLIFALLCSMSNIYGQFAPINATWHYGLPDGNGIGVERFMTYKNEKDTLINKDVYSVISAYDMFGVPIPNLRFYLSQNEDTVSYYYKDEKKTLFILNAKVNDTIEIDIYNYDKLSYKTTVKIASISWRKYNLLANDSLKTFTLEAISGQTIHGFGTYIQNVISSSNSGILVALFQFPSIPEGNPYLRCYSDTFTKYKFVPFECGFNNVGLNDFSQKTKIKLFPNPANNELFFELNSPINENTFLSIYSHFGQLTKQINLGLNQTNAVDISKLQAGLYFFNLSSNSKNYKGSFIKQ